MITELDRLTSDKVGEPSATATTFGYDQNDNRMTRRLSDNSVDEIIDYIEGSNRIEETDTLKRGIEQLPVIPDRDMVYSDVQGSTSVAGAGRTGTSHHWSPSVPDRTFK